MEPYDYGSREMVVGFGRLFAGSIALDDARLSPLFSDLSNLPPLLVQVGGAERLYDEAVELVERARRQGSEATLDVLPEMPHIAQVLAHYCPEGRRAIERAADFFHSCISKNAAHSCRHRRGDGVRDSSYTR